MRRFSSEGTLSNDGADRDRGTALVEAIIGALVLAWAPSLVFYAGWTFLRAYLSPFGIQISELGLEAWQIAALALSGLSIGEVRGDEVLNLGWLWCMLLAVGPWLVAAWNIDAAIRISLRLISAVFLGMSVFLFMTAQGDLANSGERIADQILSGEGVLYVPYVSEATSSDTTRRAIQSCITGERLRPIFIAGDYAWSYCRSRGEPSKGFVFTTMNDGTLASMRRIGL